MEDSFLNAQTTYSWHTDTAVALADETGYISPTILVQLEQALQQELLNQGLQYVDATATGDKADVTIAIALRTRRELHSIDTASSSCKHEGCWERIDMGANTRMDLRTSGFLSADAYYQNKPIWRGWVERWLYTGDRDQALEVIGKALPALFETFPRSVANPDSTGAIK
ncbi:MAG: DUF4136 domain-containing protein [Pseudomonadales bacterium]